MAKTTIVFSGFAIDYHILGFMGLATPDMRYIPYEGTHTVARAKDCVRQYTADTQIHIVGFSMGGHFAVELSQDIPFETLTLVSFRPKFKNEEIQAFISRIKKNKSAALTAFYKACFFNRDRYHTFEKTLGNYYNELYSEDLLISQLEQLITLSTTPSQILNPSKTQYIHGLHDLISPHSEMCNFSLDTGVKLESKNMGHIA